jgi:hypothetical protein
MEIQWRPYADAHPRWPRSGRHIMASFSDDEIVVYQAFRPEVAEAALAGQHVGHPFSLSRMSWIKTGFLWMMHRCGWATKADQQRVLAIQLPRRCFERILRAAAWASFQGDLHASMEGWRASVEASEVRLQWDPDHDPAGRPQERRALQLGLRGGILADYAAHRPLRIEDLTAQVERQRRSLAGGEDLLVPDERPLPIADARILRQLKVDQP